MKLSLEIVKTLLESNKIEIEATPQYNGNEILLTNSKYGSRRLEIRLESKEKTDYDDDCNETITVGYTGTLTIASKTVELSNTEEILAFIGKEVPKQVITEEDILEALGAEEEKEEKEEVIVRSTPAEEIARVFAEALKILNDPEVEKQARAFISNPRLKLVGLSVMEKLTALSKCFNKK